MAPAFFTVVCPARKILTLARGQCYKAADSEFVYWDSGSRHALNREGT
jgi:hypothetical protein